MAGVTRMLQAAGSSSESLGRVFRGFRWLLKNSGSHRLTLEVAMNDI